MKQNNELVEKQLRTVICGAYTYRYEPEKGFMYNCGEEWKIVSDDGNKVGVIYFGRGWLTPEMVIKLAGLMKNPYTKGMSK